MDIILYIIGGAVFFYLVSRHQAVSRRTAAAFNVLLAKHTYVQLSFEEQRKVEAKTEEILGRCMPGRFTGFNGEIDKFGWYALAMNELDIPNAVKGYPGWNKVNNSFMDILPHDPILDNCSQYIKKRFGVYVTISHEHKLFDNLTASIAKTKQENI